MTNTKQQLAPEHQEFLRRLHRELVGLTRTERDDIVAELESHFRERLKNDRHVDLAAFGSVERYAAGFIAERALTVGTPLRLWRALWVGVTNVRVMLVIGVSSAMHLIALAMLVVGIAKPFTWERVGAFTAANGELVALGLYGGDLTGLTEHLGFWAMPLFCGAALAFFWVANAFVRRTVKQQFMALRASP